MDPLIVLAWCILAGLIALSIGIAVGVTVWTGHDYTRALSRLEDARFSIGSLDRRNRVLERENLWLRAQIEGNGLKVTLPASDPTRALRVEQPTGGER